MNTDIVEVDTDTNKGLQLYDPLMKKSQEQSLDRRVPKPPGKHS